MTTDLVEMSMTTGKWQFWIDRGGTFTDIVAESPEGKLITHKLLSCNPEQYSDSSIQGIRDILGCEPDQQIPAGMIDNIKMGTTIGTNALLERKGERTVLVTSRGFRDILEIGYQNRPYIFALNIRKTDQLYEKVIEFDERYDATGRKIQCPDTESVKRELEDAFNSGIRAVAVALMHAYRYPDHELEIEEIARKTGFTQISLSHKVSPLIRIINRTQTAVVDAYLSPVLKRYTDNIISRLDLDKYHDSDNSERTGLMFMQSNGGLVDARSFQGKDCILSGPAGGIVGAVRTSRIAGFDRIISFDMGGTSTDVAHYRGEYERSFDNMIAGIHLQSPMMKIHTIAAGGGSILHFDGERMKVGPDSAGSSPGPACYRMAGPLTVTDCNVMLNRIQPDHFPHVFGPRGDMPLDVRIVHEKFSRLAQEVTASTGREYTPEEVAEGFLDVAVENMANAIKKISLQKGYDVKEYTLCCFGGAGGQHACRVADTLNISTIFIHPYAGVLSAYGIGLADQREILEQAVEKNLNREVLAKIRDILSDLLDKGNRKLVQQNVRQENIRSVARIHLKYRGSDTSLMIDLDEDMDHQSIASAFNRKHKQIFGFMDPDRTLVAEAVSMEVIGVTEKTDEKVHGIQEDPESIPAENIRIYSDRKYHETPVFLRSDLRPGCRVQGPSVIIEDTSTIVIEPGWEGKVTGHDHIVLERICEHTADHIADSSADPVMLEIFNNRFMSIAEQMGYTLQNTAHSVNIKERRDFSCALFDSTGNLIANAPHIPVHIGSMSECVRALIRKVQDMEDGDTYMVNSPYEGGTHLPDITVITPVFDSRNEIYAYVASRGHHADIGGKTPGSMPHDSSNIHEEGILTDGFRLVRNGHFCRDELAMWLNSGQYPARNPAQNISDIQAQVAANEKGVIELRKLVEQYLEEVIASYMKHVQDNAENEVRKVIDVLKDGSFSHRMDDESIISVKITIDRTSRSACIDFTGTSGQVPGNSNAPASVCRAAVLYVFRTLIQSDIPLNDGCLRPLEIIIPEGSMLDPEYPAAVVAGNVETSQCIVDTLFAALGVMAASQGTMNNFTFGNDSHQYYETICGGAGAGAGFNGADAVHTHMTNSRITDPEVLEIRHPVILEEFSIRKNSGGSGKYRGGNGALRKIRFLERMNATILSGHRKYPPPGLCGAGNGKCGVNRIIRKDGTVTETGASAGIEMNEGDLFLIETPGGGGYQSED